MEVVSIGVLLFYGIGIIFIIGALIYLIAKRIEAKRHEDFESRDN